MREKYHSKVIDYIQFGGKEVISAYWFDGLTSSLIYRFSPSHHPNDEINKGTDLLQSIGQYWEWASLYCCGARNDAGKVMGLAAFGDVDQMSEKTSLSITDKCELNLNFIELKKILKSQIYLD